MRFWKKTLRRSPGYFRKRVETWNCRVPGIPSAELVNRGAVINDQANSQTFVTVIESGSGKGTFPWHDLWRYRELFVIFALRDLKIRYKQTVAGVGWVLLQPILSTLMFLLLLNVLQARVVETTSQAGTESPSLTLSILSGVVLWHLLAHVIQTGSESVVSNQSLVTKVFFPRLILPVAPLLSGLVDLGIGTLLILLLKFLLPSSTGWQILMVPLFVGMLGLLGIGASIWLAALNAFYRDVRFIVPFFLQLWFYLSPVIYRESEIPSRWHWLYECNPTVGPLEGFRWALLGTPAPSSWSLLTSLALSLCLLATGGRHFRKVEQSFADWI